MSKTEMSNEMTNNKMLAIKNIEKKKTIPKTSEKKILLKKPDLVFLFSIFLSFDLSSQYKYKSTL